MKQQTKETFIVVGVVTLACILVLVIIFDLGSEKEKYDSESVIKDITEEGILSDCSNMSLEESVGCLVENVVIIYKPKLQRDSKDMTFEELLEEGGDCRNYAFLYLRLAKELGFDYSTTYRMELDDSFHRVAMISDGYDYCIIDQTSYFCKDLKGNGK